MSDQNLIDTVHALEAELRRLGLLTGPLQPAVIVHSPFGRDEMPFEHWLARVLLPRAHEAIASGRWPARSEVGSLAVREFDGRDEFAPLVGLLGRFDALVEARSTR